MNLNLRVKEIEHPETASSKAKPNIKNTNVDPLQMTSARKLLPIVATCE